MKVKKVLSLFVAAFLLLAIFALFPMPVHAETISGVCGDDLTWTLDDQGTLTISGTGEMYKVSGRKSWHKYMDNIKNVVIEEGMTTIGMDAFTSCSNLRSVTIPETVTEIYTSAFEFCSSLETVQLPSSLTVIGDSAFRGCRNLRQIQLPYGLTHIDSYAFSMCSNLQEIQLPNSLLSIGAGAFQQCESLTTVYLPYGLQVINQSIFAGCTALTSISIPETVCAIAPDAFDDCERLEQVRYGGSKSDWTKMMNDMKRYGQSDAKYWLDEATIAHRCVLTGNEKLDSVLEVVRVVGNTLSIIVVCGAVVVLMVIVRRNKRFS